MQVMKEKMGNPDSERRAEFYQQPWCHEAVPRYFYSKVKYSSQPPIFQLPRVCCVGELSILSVLVATCVTSVSDFFIFIFSQVAQRKSELEQAMGIKHP